MMNETEATAKGKEMVERLGAGWEARVWENLGWHAAAHKHNVAVFWHPRGNSYSTLVSSKASSSGTGLTAWSQATNKDYADPRESVRAAVTAVNNYITRLEAAQAEAQQCVDHFE